MKHFRILVLLTLLSVGARAQKIVEITSPDKKLVCTVRIDKEGIHYQLAREKKTLISSSQLSLQFDGKDLSPSLTVSKLSSRDGVENYTLINGKASAITDHFKEVVIPITEKDAPHTKFNLIFRAFNEGVAFRYELLGRDGAKRFTLTDELAEFRLTENPTAKVLPLPNYTSSHEGFYTTAPLQNLPANTLMDMPVLFQYADKTFLTITEAALLDYAGMYLMKENNVLRSKLAPYPSQPAVKVKGSFPHQSPWRVIMASRNFDDLISSNMLTTLCPPQRIKDTSWLKPGKTTFPWWNGNVTTDTLNAPGNNFVTQKFFIDFCKRNKIEYHSVVEYGLHQWYTDDGVGFQPGPNSDVTKPVPGLDMKEVCDYAHSQGVGVRVWVQWAALYPKLDAAFAKFEQWGLSGMMIDFMDRDDQEMVNIQTEMLEKAARHHLHVQFHGAYKPTGLNRTYPNEFTREGTLNYEVNKWSEGLPASHDLDIAFTRLLAGQVDYHLGGFRAVPDSLYRTQYTRPLMHGTRAHMLAMYVVLESALGMVCDYPDAYEGQEGFEFIQQVPTTWDETVVLKASLDEYIVIARRKGNAWYIGALNNNQARSLTIPLDFLSGDGYTATVFGDRADANRYPNKIKKSTQAVKSGSTITLGLAASGGATVILKK